MADAYIRPGHLCIIFGHIPDNFRGTWHAVRAPTEADVVWRGGAGSRDTARLAVVPI